ncbi:MAG: hypothetical protein AB7V47_05300 [Phycisphaerales bacterium]
MTNRRGGQAQLDPVVTMARWIPEPMLEFAGKEAHSDPKVGIPLYGPKSFGTSRHKYEAHIGFIGTGESVSHAQAYLTTLAGGIDGDDGHAPFPGCTKDLGFRFDLRMDDRIQEIITRNELNTLLGETRSKVRFEAAVDLLIGKLQALSERDHPLDYVILALPQDILESCRVADYSAGRGNRVHRDLRRAFKARAMRFRVPTQILLDTTTGVAKSRRDLDHLSTIAWNIFTGLYAKIDGLPWGPIGLPPSSCFIGISFYRPLGESSLLQTSVAQAFDENGEGLVLRGHSFEWDERTKGKSPHLPAELAQDLVNQILDRYKTDRQGQVPKRVVVHKTSVFTPAEQAGFEKALSGVHSFDLVAVRPSSSARLLRAGNYPPLRGTCFTAGDVAFLYTTGYLRAIGGYPHGHVPSTLQVVHHVGDTAKPRLLEEMLLLTKMNWNSANMGGLFPITLRFSRLVGDVLRELGPEDVPQAKYRYYM